MKHNLQFDISFSFLVKIQLFDILINLTENGRFILFYFFYNNKIRMNKRKKEEEIDLTNHLNHRIMYRKHYHQN